LAIIAALIGVSACNLLSPKPAVWNAAFQVTRAQVYYCPVVPLGELYCMTWQADSSTFSGTITEASPPQLSVNGSTLVATDAAPMTFTNQGTGGCVGFLVEVTLSGNTTQGSWTESQDCHGLTRVGTVVLTRQ